MPIEIRYPLDFEGNFSPFGKASLALFLSILKEENPGLAEELHSAELKPFTTSIYKENGKFNLRFTLFSPSLEFLKERLLGLEGRGVEISGTPCRVGRPEVREKSFEELMERRLFSPSPPSKFILSFKTPAVFKSSDLFLPFPLPKLLFGGLLDKWNRFAGRALSEDFRFFAERCIAVSRYKLETVLWELEEGARVQGFLGSCSYAVLVKDPYWTRVAGLLLEFAEFGGIGAKTAMGMGISRCERFW
jgi:CRISPR-associated endoribonuclease Cas6